MSSRARKLVVPENRFERAAWLDEHMHSHHLKNIPLVRGWEGVAQLERQIFPKPMNEFLGGSLDPICPGCGVETDEGTVERVGEVFRVDYGCHAFQMTEEQLRSRVRRAGQR